MKCPRCGLEMVCYVSSPVVTQRQQRRLYFSCPCGMIAARNEDETMDDAGLPEQAAR
jgi:hypothetical protein